MLHQIILHVPCSPYTLIIICNKNNCAVQSNQMVLSTEVQQQTLVIESELFRHRLAVLQDIVTALLTDNQHQQFGGETCLAELRNLENRLNILAQNVVKAGSLNAGGKFEWIDSVLVKVRTVCYLRLAL